MDQLRLTTGGDEYSLELRAEVTANGFSGEGSAYFSLEQIANFATVIEAYPLPSENAPCLVGGYWKNGEIKQEHLFLSVYPIGSSGRLGMRVRLATPQGDNERAESRHAVEVELHTTYQQLSAFARDLRHIAAGEVWDATLPPDEV